MSDEILLPVTNDGECRRYLVSVESAPTLEPTHIEICVHSDEAAIGSEGEDAALEVAKAKIRVRKKELYDAAVLAAEIVEEATYVGPVTL